MARYTEARCRLCRRSGEKLMLKGDKCLTKCIFDKRPNRQDHSLAAGPSFR
jgi:small subunit ribosomal protein S4